MIKYIDKKLGVSTFWKFEQFNKGFLKFVQFFFCCYGLIKVCLRKKSIFWFFVILVLGVIVYIEVGVVFFFVDMYFQG